MRAFPQRRLDSELELADETRPRERQALDSAPWLPSFDVFELPSDPRDERAEPATAGLDRVPIHLHVRFH